MTQTRRSKEPPAAAMRSALGVAAVALFAAGCMTAKVDETRQVAAAIQADESIVVLKKPQLEGLGTEEKFLDCVQENLGGELVHPEEGQQAKASKSAVPFKIFGEQQFSDALFPWFEPSTAPANAAGMRALLERPGVTERLGQIGVRYVVWLEGNTRKTDSGGRRRLLRGRLVGKAVRLRRVGLGPAIGFRARVRQYGRDGHVGPDRGRGPDPDHHSGPAHGV